MLREPLGSKPVLGGYTAPMKRNSKVSQNNTTGDVDTQIDFSIPSELNIHTGSHLVLNNERLAPLKNKEYLFGGNYNTEAYDQVDKGNERFEIARTQFLNTDLSERNLKRTIVVASHLND